MRCRAGEHEHCTLLSLMPGRQEQWLVFLFRRVHPHPHPLFGYVGRSSCSWMMGNSRHCRVTRCCLVIQLKPVFSDVQTPEMPIISSTCMVPLMVLQGKFHRRIVLAPALFRRRILFSANTRFSAGEIGSDMPALQVNRATYCCMISMNTSLLRLLLRGVSGGSPSMLFEYFPVKKVHTSDIFFWNACWCVAATSAGATAVVPIHNRGLIDTKRMSLRRTAVIRNFG